MKMMQAVLLDSADSLIGVILALGFGILIFAFAMIVVMVITYWRIFEKAGRPGWHSIIPILNTYDMYDLSWNSTMAWVAIGLSIASSIFSNAAENSDSDFAGFLTGVIGLAYVVVYAIQCYKLSLSFGYGIGFCIGLCLLPPIFLMILAFGSARYMGPGGVMKTAGFGAPGMPGYGAPAPYGTQNFGANPAYGDPNMNQMPPYGAQGANMQQPQSNPFENNGNNYNNYN